MPHETHETYNALTGKMEEDYTYDAQLARFYDKTIALRDDIDEVVTEVREEILKPVQELLRETMPMTGRFVKSLAYSNFLVEMAIGIKTHEYNRRVRAEYRFNENAIRYLRDEGVAWVVEGLGSFGYERYDLPEPTLGKVKLTQKVGKIPPVVGIQLETFLAMLECASERSAESYLPENVHKRSIIIQAFMYTTADDYTLTTTSKAERRAVTHWKREMVVPYVGMFPVYEEVFVMANLYNYIKSARKPIANRHPMTSAFTDEQRKAWMEYANMAERIIRECATDTLAQIELSLPKGFAYNRLSAIQTLFYERTLKLLHAILN